MREGTRFTVTAEKITKDGFKGEPWPRNERLFHESRLKPGSFLTEKLSPENSSHLIDEGLKKKKKIQGLKKNEPFL